MGHSGGVRHSQPRELGAGRDADRRKRSSRRWWSSMRRLTIPEIEDQSFTPAWLRDLLTDFLCQMATSLELYAPVKPLIERMLRSSETRAVVDLCSGAGGPWRSLADADWTVPVTLTDLRPHTGRDWLSDVGSGFSYESEPVDALHVPARLAGVRTLFSGLHHLSDAEARALFESAMEEKCPIGAFEFVERRSGRLAVDAVMAPLLVLLLTPQIQPRLVRRYVFTYFIPLVPLVVLWDALASDLRSRTVAELEALVEPLQSPEYCWEVGTVESARTRTPITYVIGEPRPAT
jgi:hypothetical protein